MNGTVNRGFFFGEFELDPDRRLLRKRGESVALNPKTFDLLLTLVENRGQVITKNELLDKVWKNQFVEENNLTVHVAALRKVLGETKNDHRFIVTVPGKGYSFVAALNERDDQEIVVESHKFERIVVEQEIEERTSENNLEATGLYASGPYQNAGPARGIETAPLPRRTLLGWIKEPRVVASVLAAVLAAIGGGYLLRGRSSASPPPTAPFVQHSIRQLTTTGNVGNAALSPDGKLFAYTIDELGQKSLWLGYVDGGNHLVLRPATEATYHALAFSPDSTHIYFSIRDDKNPKSALFKIPVFGGVQTKVLDAIESFSLSPDGKHIAIARPDREKGRDAIVIAALDGSERRDVASFPADRSFVFSTISWSPDGKRLAASSLRDSNAYFHEVSVIEISSGEITRIPIDNWRDISKTAWLRDDRGLVISAIEKDSHSSVPQYQLLHVAYPGGEAQNITADRSNYGPSWHNDAGVTLSLSAASDSLLTVEHRQLCNVWVAPSDDLRAARQITFSAFGKYDGLWGMDWTPDGRLIYTTSDTRSQFISTMNADGSQQSALTSPGFFDSVLTVSTDGRYVLFHSNRGVDIGADIDVWQMDVDGGNPKQLTFGGGGFHPAPSPDGRWIYYTSWLNGGGLCRVPVDGGEPETVNDKQTSWGSFSPDGRYFAASYRTDKERLAVFSTGTHELINQYDLPKTGTLYMGTHWTADGRAVTYRDSAYGYWLQPVAGGEPKRLEGLPKEKLYNFAWSKDGRWLAFVRGPEIRDVVLFSNIAK